MRELCFQLGLRKTATRVGQYSKRRILGFPVYSEPYGVGPRHRARTLVWIPGVEISERFKVTDPTGAVFEAWLEGSGERDHSGLQR